jgi:hypothetical protein
LHQIVIRPLSSFLQLDKCCSNFSQLPLQWIVREIFYPAFFPGKNFTYVFCFEMREGATRAFSKSCRSGGNSRFAASCSKK